MGVIQKYGSEPNKMLMMATYNDVEEELQEFVTFIEQVEKQYNTVMIGERQFFSKWHTDFDNKITRVQLGMMVSQYRKAIIEKYEYMSKNNISSDEYHKLLSARKMK